MKLSKKTLRSIYFTVEQMEKLKKLSEKTRVPQAVYIRDGLDLVLKMHARKAGKKRVTHQGKNAKHTSLKLLKR